MFLPVYQQRESALSQCAVDFFCRYRSDLGGYRGSDWREVLPWIRLLLGVRWGGLRVRIRIVGSSTSWPSSVFSWVLDGVLAQLSVQWVFPSSAEFVMVWRSLFYSNRWSLAFLIECNVKPLLVWKAAVSLARFVISLCWQISTRLIFRLQRFASPTFLEWRHVQDPCDLFLILFVMLLCGRELGSIAVRSANIFGNNLNHEVGRSGWKYLRYKVTQL